MVKFCHLRIHLGIETVVNYAIYTLAKIIQKVIMVSAS